MEEFTWYAKLRPPLPTPTEERCQCTDRPAIKLMSALTENPIHCMQCNVEVPPQALALSEEVVDMVAHWNALYHALDVLWLDSGAYETWAREQLAEITSAVNTLGRAAQRVLNNTQRCYYWYFQDQSAAAYRPLRSCPVCREVLLDYRIGTFAQRVCERDSIVVVGK